MNFNTVATVSTLGIQPCYLHFTFIRAGSQWGTLPINANTFYSNDLVLLLAPLPKKKKKHFNPPPVLLIKYSYNRYVCNKSFVTHGT